MARAGSAIFIPPALQRTWISLADRQRAFILNYFAHGGNATRAYLHSGYTVKNEAVAASSACQLLNHPKIIEIIYAILHAQRLTPEYADLKHFEALEATETKYFAHEGKVLDERECVAWGPRVQALDLLHKIHKRYGNFDGVSVTLITPPDWAAFDEALRVRRASQNGSALPAASDPGSHHRLGPAAGPDA